MESSKPICRKVIYRPQGLRFYFGKRKAQTEFSDFSDIKNKNKKKRRIEYIDYHQLMVCFYFKTPKERRKTFFEKPRKKER